MYQLTFNMYFKTYLYYLSNFQNFVIFHFSEQKCNRVVLTLQLQGYPMAILYFFKKEKKHPEFLFDKLFGKYISPNLKSSESTSFVDLVRGAR